MPTGGHHSSAATTDGRALALVRRIWNLRGLPLAPTYGLGDSDSDQIGMTQSIDYRTPAGQFKPGAQRTGAAPAQCHNAPGPKKQTSLALTPLPSPSQEEELNAFLKSVELRAFKRTVYAVRQDDAALDIVQDAMIRLAQSYAERPANEWPMLFQRILSNATLDWFRRQKVRNAVFTNMGDIEAAAGGEDGDFDLLEALDVEDTGTEAAETQVGRAQVLAQIEDEIGKLPGRQREAFLLRYWEELDVAETAAAMGCSEGSVKTHCSRAVKALSTALLARGITL
jgi:RNA polymerase sigma-70 factor (ECF subfamily)